MAGWKKVSITRRGAVESRAGCYVVFLDDSAVYVGQSFNLRRRIDGYRCENHPGIAEMSKGFVRTPWGDFPWRFGQITLKVKYTRRFGEQLMLEARLIRRLHPTCNVRGKV